MPVRKMPENSYCLFRTTEETTKPEVAHINGSIPSWLNGTFLRTGPGKWDFDNNFTMNHWVDGFAILSKFLINGSEQKVTLEKQFLKSDAYTRGCNAGKPVITEFGTKAYPDPSRSFFSRLLSAVLPIELSDNDSINLYALGSDVFALSETCYFRSIDPCTLSTGDKHDVNKYFGVHIASAHPQLDSETGITYNMGCTILTGLKYHIYAIPPPTPNTPSTTKEILKKSKILASIPSSHIGLQSYNHSFGMTRNYIILIEQPFVMNIAKAAKTYLKGSPVFRDFVEWRPDLKNRFYIIDKNSGDVIKTEYVAVENFFFLHFVNCYDEDDQIVIDLMSYKNADLFDATYLESLRTGQINGSAFQAKTVRYVLPILESNSNIAENINLVQLKSEAKAILEGKAIILTPETLTLPGLESPILNKNFISKKYSYFYGAGVLGQHHFSNSIVKYDIRKKTYISWKGTNEQFPGEPQFVPNPLIAQSSSSTSGSVEDDGILMSIVTEMSSLENGFILFLNAKTMEEIGRAKFQAHLPIACHGLYLPSEYAEE